MKRWINVAIALLFAVLAAPTAAQDALTLPTDLYVLLNDGIVQRYSPGVGMQTLTPEDQFVIDFGIDPTGTRIAYRTQGGLYIASIGDETLPPLSDALADVPPLRGRGQTVVWSPFGDAMAYTTQAGARIYFTNLGVAVALEQPGLAGLSWSPDGQYLAAEAEHNIWWIYKRDGTSLALRAAIPSSMGTEWIDKSSLAFAPEAGGLLLMNLDQSNAQSTLLGTNMQYRLPRLSNDGRLLMFQRDPSDAAIPEGYGQLVALQPGIRQVLDSLGTTPIDLRGNLRWAPGGSLMIAFEGGILALFDPATGQGIPLPINNAVVYAWGPYPPPAPATSDASPAA